MTKDTFTVGRSLDCDIHLNDVNISRVHLFVTSANGQIFIEDKDSSNGTFKNKSKIKKGVAVKIDPADKIRFGQSEYVISFELGEIEVTEALPQNLSPVVPEKNPSGYKPQLLPDKVLVEARKNAAQIILEAEKEGDKRAQVLHQKGQEARRQGDLYYQKMVSDSQAKSDEIFAQAQQQGQDLLRDARNMAQTLREDVDIYIQSLRDQANAELANIISAAKTLAEEIKTDATAVAGQMISEATLRVQSMVLESEQNLQNAEQKLSEANQNAQTLLTDANEKSERIILEATQQANQNKLEAEISAKKITDEAAINAEKLLAEIIVKSDQTALESKELSEKMKAEAEIYAKKTVDEANDLVQTLVSEATKKSELLILSATQQSDASRLNAEELVKNASEQAAKTQLDSQFESERILKEAQEKANIIQIESRTAAASSAHKTISEAAEWARLKVIETEQVTQESEKKFKEAQTLAQKMVEEATEAAEKIKTEAEDLVKKMIAEATEDSIQRRVGASIEAQRVITEALAKADQTCLEARTKIEKLKSEEIETCHKMVNQEAERLIKRAQEEAEELLEQAKKNASDIQAQSTEASQKFSQTFLELNEAQNKLNRVAAEVTEKDQKLKGMLEQIQQEESQYRKFKDHEEKVIAELRETHQEMIQAKKGIEPELNLLQTKKRQLVSELKDLESKNLQLIKENESKKILISEKFEKELQVLIKTEEARMSETQISFAKRRQQMEQSLLEGMMAVKADLNRDIYAALEKEIVRLLDPSQWRMISSPLKTLIRENIERKIAQLSQSNASADRPVDLLKKRKIENLRWLSGGLVMGLLAVVGAQKVNKKLREDLTPMQTRVIAEAKIQKEDLEKRRFNPAQVQELKDSYADSVIYTKDFVAIYTDQDYQERLYRATSQYLLKTWRMEEEKTLQVLGVANALVRELNTSKSNIHPDFVKKGVEKMHETESQALIRMKEILGSEVRLESFRRFEGNFFAEEIQHRNSKAQ